MDFAKVVRLIYEFPQSDLKALSQPCMSPAKRITQFPDLLNARLCKSCLVTIPTVAGTSQEINTTATWVDEQG